MWVDDAPEDSWCKECDAQAKTRVCIGREVLRLLTHRGEMTGLELVDASAGVLSRGTVYVHLLHLWEKGYVGWRHRDEAGETRVYRATSAGMQAYIWGHAKA